MALHSGTSASPAVPHAAAGIAVVRLDNPPVNALSHAHRQRIAAELAAAESDASIRAIILIGNAEFFSAGADVREFNTPQAIASPTLPGLIRALERSSKLTIAALSGSCLGGGFELAMGCHLRVASASARVGLPEVKLGLIPGAGGTQRLPRLVGLELALNMIVSGEPRPAQELAGTALFARIVEGDLLEGARAVARERLANGAPIVRVRDLRVAYPAHEPFLQFARTLVRAKAGPYPAPLACVEALAASVTSTSFEEGERKEREIFLGLMQAPESRALRHVFFAERAAVKIADVPADTPLRPVAEVAVIGAGTMGTGIAMSFLNAGLAVRILEQAPQALEKGIASIRRNYESSLKKGKLTEAQLAARLRQLTPTLLYEDLRGADLIVEAVFEDLAVKQEVFRALDAIAKPGAILATNTSTLDVNAIAASTRRPADVLGMHFFSPANVMRLLEVVRGEATAKDVLATVMQLAKKIRKLAIVAGVCDGFIGNRMIHRYSAQAGFLLEEGCLPEHVDAAMERFGFAMGPFRMSDLAGNDIGWAIRKRRAAEGRPYAYTRIADRLCELGRFGQKSGAGWYDYRPGERTPRPNAEVNAMIVEYSAQIGLERRAIADEEIIERLVYALVNEGARILEECIAQRASDIDLVYLNGYGFPAWRGGPMYYADTVGLGEVLVRMRHYAQGRHGELWTPAPLITRLAAEGGTFT